MAFKDGTFGKHGITEDTPKNIPFGPGAVYKNLVYDATTKKWTGDVLCATKDGSKFSIVPNIVPLEVDGANVAFVGSDMKVGEAATMEINVAEYKNDLIANAVIGDVKTDEKATDYEIITTKEDVGAGDYISNLAFVGLTATKTPIVVIFEKALCTSGFESEHKPKAQGGYALKFEARATDMTGNLDKLPVKIYRPKTVSK